MYGLGAALARSRLLYRITLLILRRFPPSFVGHVLALAVAGVASTVLIPSVQGRVTLIGPMLASVSETLGYPPRSRGSAGLAMATFLGFTLATTLLLTGTSTCLLAWGMLPEATREEISWLRWLQGVLLLEVVVFVAAVGRVVWRYRPSEVRPVGSGLLDTQLQALGPLSHEERTTGSLPQPSCWGGSPRGSRASTRHGSRWAASAPCWPRGCWTA